jgi:hypothetical protein
MEAAPRPGRDETAPIRIGWELLHLLQLSVRSLEDSATRILAAQIAGLIALWTQLYTFEEAVPRTLAWTAWVTLLASIAVLGTLVTPRRLSGFWEGIDAGAAVTQDDAPEREIIDGLSTTLRLHRDRLARALRRSIALGIVGLAVAALAYVVDKGLYAP